MDAVQLLLAGLSGGSVLAGPLLLYVVGVRDPHVAHRRRSMSQRGLFSSPLPAPRGA